VHKWIKEKNTSSKKLSTSTTNFVDFPWHNYQKSVFLLCFSPIQLWGKGSSDLLMFIFQWVT
jgi:hypothetical protein